MKFLFELLPIILFFVAYKFKGIFFATSLAIAASLVQIAFTYLRTRKVELIMWVSLGVILVFGSATLIFRNEIFIKWKPTVLYWIFAGAIFSIKFIFKKNAIQGLLKSQLVLPQNVWERLNIGWGTFFAVLGAINLFVAYNFPTNTWVNFKLFGIMGLVLLFVILQGIFLAKYIEEDKKS
ncbi:MAG: septation protein A [Elusimicrobia bacterium]|nr:septation protein A [Candidatus Liberimonas magnetica]